MPKSTFASPNPTLSPPMSKPPRMGGGSGGTQMALARALRASGGGGVGGGSLPGASAPMGTPGLGAGTAGLGASSFHAGSGAGFGSTAQHHPYGAKGLPRGH